jgi:hypothetical protein
VEVNQLGWKWEQDETLKYNKANNFLNFVLQYKMHLSCLMEGQSVRWKWVEAGTLKNNKPSNFLNVLYTTKCSHVVRCRSTTCMQMGRRLNPKKQQANNFLNLTQQYAIMLLVEVNQLG